MPDPVDPTQPPPPSSPEPELRTTSTSTGLPSNVAAAIACIPLIGGIIFYILENHDPFVRFYAMQSIIFGCMVSLQHCFGDRPCGLRGDSGYRRDPGIFLGNHRGVGSS